MIVLGPVTMTVTRQDPGEWVDGLWVDGAGGPTTFTVVASVQPITPELIEQLDEGARTSARFVMYASSSEAEINTVDIGTSQRPDRVDYDGRNYMTQSIGDWGSHTAGLPYREYIMLQVGEDE